MEDVPDVALELEEIVLAQIDFLQLQVNGLLDYRLQILLHFLKLLFVQVLVNMPALLCFDKLIALSHVVAALW